MARPNEGKESSVVYSRNHAEFLRFMDAFRKSMLDEGQKGIERLSLADLEKQFIEHYWRITRITLIGKLMRKYYFHNGNI